MFIEPTKRDPAVDDHQLAVVAEVGPLVPAAQRLHRQHQAPRDADPRQLASGPGGSPGSGATPRWSTSTRTVHAAAHRPLDRGEERPRRRVERQDVELDVRRSAPPRRSPRPGRRAARRSAAAAWRCCRRPAGRAPDSRFSRAIAASHGGAPCVCVRCSTARARSSIRSFIVRCRSRRGLRQLRGADQREQQQPERRAARRSARIQASADEGRRLRGATASATTSSTTSSATSRPRPAARPRSSRAHCILLG